MRIADILTGNLQQELAKVRAEYKRLQTIGAPPAPERPKYDNGLFQRMQQRVNDGSLSIEDYRAWAEKLMAPHEAKMNRWFKDHQAYTNRMSQLLGDFERLRGQLRYTKSVGTPSGIFASRESDPFLRQNEHYFDPLGRIIDQANEDLPDPAASVITKFVGHPNRTREEHVGIWSPDSLEDVFSDRPKRPESQLVRQQLETAMRPLREYLRQRFGDTIPLHRAQDKLTGKETPRRVLSWTASPHFAKHIAGEHRDLLSVDMPLNKIVWITNRANQQEFICLT